MPFIKGRYHINPIVGAALEAAREAEESAGSTQQSAHNDDSEKTAGSPVDQKSGPIHRVEIETAEVVPAHSGSAQRGFVARIHRSGNPSGAASDAELTGTARSLSREAPRGQTSAPGRGREPQGPETHVFADHRDLTDFLRSEFERDCNR